LIAQIRIALRWLIFLTLCSASVLAQQVTLTARVELVGEKSHHTPKAGNVVIWLMPATGTPPSFSVDHPRLVQKDKSFEPHVLVVPVGTVVEFPNRDPFFHNVFSLFEGKSFDLGLYEAGTSRDVRFDKPGISYIFCNIHPNMSAVVIALDTPYFGISNAKGEIVIPEVPVGRYTLRVWYEEALPDSLKQFTRQVTVSESSSTLGVLRLPTNTLAQTHKNKYGRDYDTAAPSDSPAYPHP
jgi:plastocyanin